MKQGRIKVLYLITKARWGGAQRYVYDLATTLPKDSFEVVVATGQSGALTERLTEAGVRTITIPSLMRDVSMISDTRSFFTIKRMLSLEKPDVVHLNSSKAAGIGALAARLTGGVPRIIFTAHGWPFQERRSILARLAIWFFSWITALLSHTIICVSKNDYTLACHMSFIRKKAVLIHNGIDTHSTFGDGHIIRDAFPTGVRITGTIGELTKNKNHRSLIEEAHSQGDMYVAIVGEGEDREKLEQLITQYGLEERVKLFGYIPAREALKGFDVFSLPSLKEGLPYVLLEAKLAGIPIEANRVGGVGDILDGSIEDFSLEEMMNKTKALY